MKTRFAPLLYLALVTKIQSVYQQCNRSTRNDLNQRRLSRKQTIRYVLLFLCQESSPIANLVELHRGGKFIRLPPRSASLIATLRCRLDSIAICFRLCNDAVARQSQY